MQRLFKHIDTQKDNLLISSENGRICIRCTDSITHKTAAVILNDNAIQRLRDFLDSI